MKYICPLLAVSDLARSKRFYSDLLGLEVERDYGANVTLTGGISLQTLETWSSLLGRERDDIAFGSCAGELYFEQDDLESFERKLDQHNVELVHPAVEHPWGQRAVRFFDPDRHIIEVGESLRAAARRLAAVGLDEAAIASRMGVTAAEVGEWLA